ncbi:hypothetical protein DV735_g2468, partial [Chaetothyriales sp. CBS 134920]
MAISAEAANSIKASLDNACADSNKGIPGLVGVAVGKDGKELFAHAAGKRGFGSQEPMTVDSVFWIASCTKLITGIAVMQLVEQGKLSLDDADQVAKLLPEVANAQVLDKDGKLVPQKQRITLRMLLTHTAGFGYTFFNERLRKHGKPVGYEEFSGQFNDFVQPLVNQPGEAWEYGINLDWAGFAVERATNLSLDEYFQRNIFQPLGIKNISLFPSQEMKDKLAFMNSRSADGQLHPRDHLLHRPLVIDAKEAATAANSGGAGAFAQPREYAKILATLLNDGTSPTTGAQILKKETVDEMFTNQIPQFPDFGRQGIVASKPDLTNPVPDLYPGKKQGWGLTFMLSDGPTGRSDETAHWAGLANLFWWIDRTRGVAGMIATQILPFGDPQVLGQWVALESGIYSGLTPKKRQRTAKTPANEQDGFCSQLTENLDPPFSDHVQQFTSIPDLDHAPNIKSVTSFGSDSFFAPAFDSTGHLKAQASQEFHSLAPAECLDSISHHPIEVQHAPDSDIALDCWSSSSINSNDAEYWNGVSAARIETEGKARQREHRNSHSASMGRGDSLTVSSGSPSTSHFLAEGHNRLCIRKGLLKIYHDSLEGALGCWLNERNCPYASRPFLDSNITWGARWGNRILSRVTALDEAYAKCNALSTSHQKEAIHVLNLVLMAFGAQWAQAAYQNQCNVCEQLPEHGIFGRNLQSSLWHQANLALSRATSNPSFKVIFAAVIFSMTQRQMEDAEVLETSGSPGQSYSAALRKISELDTGGGFFLDVAIRKMHDHRRRLLDAEQSADTAALQGLRSIKEDDKQTFAMIFWLAIICDTIGAVMARRSFVLSDADTSIISEKPPSRRLSRFNNGSCDLDGFYSFSNTTSAHSDRGPQIWGDYFLAQQTRIGDVRKESARWPCSYTDAAACLADSAPVKVLFFRRLAHLQDLYYQRASAEEIERAITSTLEVYIYWNNTYGCFMSDWQSSDINAFTASQGAGRSAPTLAEDLTIYDPQRAPPESGLLAEPPITFVGGRSLADQLPPDSCRHEFWLKRRQSSLPQLDERATADTTWTVASLCRKCRLHLRVTVDYTTGPHSEACPNAEGRLHHLVRCRWREADRQRLWNRARPGSPVQVYVYECSTAGCSAIVSALFTPPEISAQVVHALTDAAALKERVDAAFSTMTAHTQGMRRPLPIDVVNDLRIYIRNAWDNDPSRSTIKLSNRRFTVRFGPGGQPCKGILEGIGFRLDVAAQCWHVPQPVREDEPLQDLDNVYLDNVEQELLALVESRPPDERHHVSNLPRPEPALPQIERVLGCADYDKLPASRSRPVDPSTRPPEFQGLGVPEAASDSLVQRFYHTQRIADAANGPLYLSFLKKIGIQRNSELLQTETGLEASRGHYDAETVNTAYNYFGLGQDDGSVDDDYIIGIFSSRLEDSASHEQQMRHYLSVIGHHRGSAKLCQFADGSVNTYERALDYLGADAKVSDEGIQACYAVKMGENVDQEQARQAVAMIAKQRNSSFLRAWINSDFSPEADMDPAEGYSVLQISDRTCDDDLVLSAYDVAVMDYPEGRDRYTRALMAIAKDRSSSALRDRVSQNSSQPMEVSSNEPVGLENIGNTCYLNSLLQFLFTMVPLRHIVLNFDEFRLDPTDDNLRSKKVGQRNITRKEVQTAQRFVDSLSVLFQGMIHTPKSAIRPEKELAKLTLETDNAKEKLRRRSTLACERPNLDHLGRASSGDVPMLESEGTQGGVLQSPMTAGSPPNKTVQEDKKEAEDEEMTDLVDLHDDSSEATLVSKPGSMPTTATDCDTPLANGYHTLPDNKEGQSPTALEPSSSRSSSDLGHPAPLAPTAPLRIAGQAGALAQNQTTELEPVAQPIYAPPPGKPPPVPPRKPAEPTTDILEEYARQQDVTEVLSHCLFQLSSAIRPTGVDPSGEQEDEIHDIFFGQNVSHTVPETEAAKAVQFYSIIARVASQPKDVYEAIDTEYDLSEREGGSQAFASMSKLPPVISILLDRVAWDSELKRPIKLNHHVEIPERIFLDRYLEAPTGSDLFERRKQAWAWKRELIRLNKRCQVLETSYAGAADVPSLFEDAKAVLESLQTSFPGEAGDQVDGSLQIDPDLVSNIGTLAEELRLELKNIKARINALTLALTSCFTDTSMRQHPYRLHAAFFHRGGASGGHYWVYIYDHAREVWRKYNDDRVSIVDNLNEIFAQADTSNSAASPNASPYFLVYVAEDKISSLVETVKRDIVWPAPDEDDNNNNNVTLPVLPGRPLQGQEMTQISAKQANGMHVNRRYEGYDKTSRSNNNGINSINDLEMQDYRHDEHSTPAVRSAWPSNGIDHVEYAPVERTVTVGNWNDQEADPDRTKRW